jgi:hypothetical protein
VVEVRLRVGVRIAIQGNGQLADCSHLERTGAEGTHTAVGAGRNLCGCHAGEDMLGDDADPKCKRKRRARSAKGKNHLPRIARSHADLPPELRAGLLVLEVLKDVEREKHILRAERLAVAPLDSAADVEGVAEAILRDRPVAGQQADNVLLSVHRRQTLVNDAVDLAGAVDGLEERVQDSRRADERLDCRAATGRLGNRGDRLAPDECQRRRRTCGGKHSPT